MLMFCFVCGDAHEQTLAGMRFHNINFMGERIIYELSWMDQVLLSCVCACFCQAHACL